MSDEKIDDLAAMSRIARIMGKLGDGDREAVAEWIAKKWAPKYGKERLAFREAAAK